MNRAVALALAASLAMLLAAPLLVVSSQPAPANGVEAKMTNAFVAVSEAEHNGGNVSSLVVELNRALGLAVLANQTQARNPQSAQQLNAQAEAIASQVVVQAGDAASSGAAAARQAELVAVVEGSALAAVGAVILVKIPDMFWAFWLRTHRKWKVRSS